MTQWALPAIDPLNDYDDIAQKFRQEASAIATNRHLTPDGKQAAHVKAAQAALKALTDLHTPRLAGLDADLAAHRSALIRCVPSRR